MEEDMKDAGEVAAELDPKEITEMSRDDRLQIRSLMKTYQLATAILQHQD